MNIVHPKAQDPAAVFETRAVDLHIWNCSQLIPCQLQETLLVGVNAINANVLRPLYSRAQSNRLHDRKCSSFKLRRWRCPC